jgi:hypothetical protein
MSWETTVFVDFYKNSILSVPPPHLQMRDAVGGREGAVGEEVARGGGKACKQAVRYINNKDDVGNATDIILCAKLKLNMHKKTHKNLEKM